MSSKKERIGVILICVISALSTVLIFMYEPIEQDPTYHLFVDQRAFFGIPNFFNVASNIPFLFVGIFGLYWLKALAHKKHKPEVMLSYAILFIGIGLVALGSSYYHLWPGNETLVWDRLPMTIAFMALCSVIAGEFISTRYGKSLLFTLLIFGFFSVIYWHYTETQGSGDLRLYALVQFLPLLLAPVILLCFKPSFTLSSGYWLLMGAYILAKLLEEYDAEIFNIMPWISGHSLKHLAAAFGVFLLIQSYINRKSA